MEAFEFIQEIKRMCKSYYDAEKGYCSEDCPVQNLDCMSLDQPEEDIEHIVKVVENWSQENPRKTRQDLILEQWPNAETCKDKVLSACPKVFDSNFVCHFDFQHKTCNDCRREFWLKEVG